MEQIISDNFVDFQESNDFDVKMTQLGEYYIFRIKSNIKMKMEKPKIMNVLVIDNSGSMGHNTREATMTIGKGMFDLPCDKVNMIPVIVIVFDETA